MSSSIGSCTGGKYLRDTCLRVSLTSPPLSLAPPPSASSRALVLVLALHFRSPATWHVPHALWHTRTRTRRCSGRGVCARMCMRVHVRVHFGICVWHTRTRRCLGRGVCARVHTRVHVRASHFTDIVPLDLLQNVFSDYGMRVITGGCVCVCTYGGVILRMLSHLTSCKNSHFLSSAAPDFDPSLFAGSL